MRYCEHCKNPLEETARFCPTCGVSTDAVPVGDKNAQQETLNFMYRMLKYERLSWKIAGHVLLWMGIALAVLGLLLAAAGGEVTAVLGITYSYVFGLIYIPLGIVGLVSAGKIDKYMNSMFTDIRPTADRCGSVGMIVFGYFFNNIALIFIIINFVRTKTDKKIIDEIARNQRMSK